MSEHFKDLLYSTQGQNAQYNYPEDSLCGKVPPHSTSYQH